MQNKLQELTDKLYNEGLSKGKQQAEELKAAATKESEKIISDARAQAQQIVEAAKKEAEELRTSVANDIRMASAQTISALRQQIEQIIITAALKESVKKAVDDKEFIQSVITTIAKAFNAANPAPAELEIILPAASQDELKAFFEGQAAKALGAGIDVQFSKGIAGGFKIGPKGEGYMISFTDEDFQNILAAYLRPSAKKLLFG